MKNIKFKLSMLSLALISAGFTASSFAQETTDVGTVSIVGEDEIGGGLIVQEDGTKTRSTVTKAAIEKASPSSSPFQLLNFQPGINATSTDSTGLFGGTFHMRGFASDQIGFTINGAPVNDSGNFAVYPAEYVDNENTCELFVTQGSVDTEAPHIGASGGNVGIVTCDPKDEMGGKFSQSFGNDTYRRTYLRGDSGYLGPVKFYLSYSDSQASKFRGPGEAKKKHLDLGAQWNISENTTFRTSLLFNRQYTHHFNFFNSRKDFENGKDKVNSREIPQHNGTNDSDFGFSTTPYYEYSVNPFKNALWTANLVSRINDKLTLSANPYFWYGYGTGGLQKSALSVTNSFDGSKFGGGIKNPYPEYPSANKVGVYRSNITETNRPGITLKAKYELDRHSILAGIWYEHADHKQTGPATTVDNNGHITDAWLRSNYVTHWDGSAYQRRDFKTTTSASSLFLSDKYSATDNLIIHPGIRYVYSNRKLKGNASDDSGSGSLLGFNNSKKHNALLPSLGFSYQIDDVWQVYGDIAKNQKIANNYTLKNINKNVTYVNGKPVGQVTIPTPQKPEKSTNTELGIRFNGDMFTGSLGFFNVDFKDRQANGYDVASQNVLPRSVGDSTVRGFEFQGGTKSFNGWSFFNSLTYTHSTLDNNLLVANKAKQETLLNSDGKEFPLTPRWMAALGVQYSEGPFLASLQGKYTDKQYTTLMNDDYINSYTIFNLALAYQFQSAGLLKNPKVQFNVDNLFDKTYLTPNVANSPDIKTTVDKSLDSTGGNPAVYQGGPRFISITFSTDF